jgi:hypothetical protein
MRSLRCSMGITALSAVLQVAIAPAGSAPYCLKTMNGQLRCTYASMSECEEARGEAPSPSTQCMIRTDAHGITGLGDSYVTPPATARPSQEPER